MDGEDEKFAHGANGTITAGTCKTARRRRIASHCEFAPHTFKADPSKSATWNRGAYLVNGPAHCAECHSPRNALGAIDSGKRLSGSPNAYGQLGFPNIVSVM